MFKDQTLKCWDVPGFKERFAVTADHGPDFHNKAGFYRYGIVVSPDGSLVATYRPRSETFKVWDGTTGRAVRDLTAPSIVWSLAVSPDGRWIAAGGEGRQVTLWELASGKKLETFESAPPHTLGDDVGDGWVNQLCFGPDGRYLAAGTSYLGGTVEIHPPCHLTVRDLAAGRNRFRIDIGEHYMRGLAYSADGQQIATAGYGGVKFARKWNGAVKYWSAETGAAEGETAVDDRQYIYGVAYHPDGKRVGVFHNEPKVWDVPRR
jgi:WD40 repeat protein